MSRRHQGHFLRPLFLNRSSFKASLRVEVLEERLCFSAFYDFDIVAQTGGNLTSIQPTASINDNGQVAFVGVSSAGQAVYVGDGSSAPRVVSFDPSATRTYGQEIQINNAGLVAAVDRVNGNPTGTRARTWDSNSPGTFNILGRGTTPPSSVLPDHFDIINSFTTLSNDGTVGFSAINDASINVYASMTEVARDDFSPLVASYQSGTFFRFQVGDGDRIVVGTRDNSTSVKRITLYDLTGLDTSASIATTSNGNWSDLGVRPGISDDGKIVVFAGTLTDSGAAALNSNQPNTPPLFEGPGVFASIENGLLIGSREIIRIAGVSGNGFLDSGESFDDLNGNGSLDSNEVDEGLFTNFEFDSRLGVTSRTADLDSVTVAYVAKNNNNEKGIYSSQVTFLPTDLGSSIVSRPSRIVEVGDTIPSLGAVVDVAASDLLNNNGDLSFWASNGSGQAIVRATVSRSPVLIVPGIGGTFFNETNSSFSEWLVHRGISPEDLAIDPLAKVYSDQIESLKRAGYVEGVDLFVANYDWRVDAGPVDGQLDGKISALTTESLTDSVFEYGVDYLGYWLKRAKEAWASNHSGAELSTVDLIVHSTGGLVARAYIQSTIYGVDLPKVDNFIQIAVPNLGASKAWNPLHDNWAADLSYKVVLSKILNSAYEKLVSGSITQIEGPNPSSANDDIQLTDILVAGPDGVVVPDPVKFIHLYVPTIRSLLATYNFLDDSATGTGTLTNVNGSPSDRNNFALDLNSGLDLALAGDPRSFARLTNATMVYGLGLETATAVRRWVGPGVGSDSGTIDIVDEISPFTDFIARDPLPNETWYEDVIASDDGDGTVPKISLQFGLNDQRIFNAPFKKSGLLGGGNTTGGVGHTEIPSNVDAQKLILNLLGAKLPKDQISTDLLNGALSSLYNSSPVLVAQLPLWSLIVDPVQTAILTDGNGKRLGFSQSSGTFSEIPNSIYLGAEDGFGIIYGEVVAPIQLQIAPQNGQTYFVQVQGEQNGSQVDIRRRDNTATVLPVILSGASNSPPILDTVGDKSIGELHDLTFTATATDPDAGSVLSFSLVNAPTGATIDASTGVFSWTPTEAQGPGSFTFTVRVTDNGSPALFDEETITVTVNEVNQAPVLSAIGNKTVVSGTPLSFTATATDADLPVNVLAFSLLTAPTGATIDSSTGAFSWTPSAAQGTGDFTFTVRVTDNGSPALFGEEQITVTVQPVQANNAPTATNDSASTLLDQATTITVLSNDSDSDGTLVPSSVTVVTAPQHGTATPQSDGRIIYQPTAGYTGPDTFTYTVNDNLGATSNVASVSVTVSANNPRQVIATGSGDGQVSITLDGFGSFGSDVFDTDADAIYNPVGSIGAGGTTFESGIAFRVGDTGQRQVLTSGSIGSSGGLVNPAITRNGTSYVSSFVIGGITIDLMQSVIALQDALGNPTGSELRQVYTLRNTGTTATEFELIRYIDGDLQFDSSINDGGGRLVSSNGTEFLFETDAGGSGSTDTTFFGITAEGGTIPTTGRFEVDSYQGLRNRIIAGDPLDGIITGDTNGDGFVEAGSEYDITLALRNLFSLAVGGTATYTTRTVFGSGAPATVVEQPQGVISGTKFNDLNANGIRDKGLVSGSDPDVVFVIDVSGSTSDPFGGTAVGDLNNDGDSNTILDAEIAGFIALNQDLVNKGLGQIADVSIVAFSSSASGVDVDPSTPGIQTTTKAGADKNGNGVLDVEEALRGLGYGGNTNFEAALSQSIAILQGLGTSPENGNVVFLSDGVPNSSGAHTDEVAQLKTIANNVRAFGVGTGASLPQLQIIDTRAVQFTTTDELLTAFQGVGAGSGSTEVFTEPGLAGVTIYIDLNNNGQLDAGEPNTLTRQDDPATTTVDELGTYQFTQLAAGTYTVREVVPNGFQQTLPGGASRAYVITLAANAGSTGNDFGNTASRATNSISGYVYADVDNDGNRFVTIGGRQVPQTGLPNVKVELINTTTGVIVEALTNADGFYEFTMIADGTYSLRETQPIIFVDGKETAGTPALATLGGTIVNDAFENLQLVGGVTATEYNFGERGLKAAYVTKSLLLSSTPNNATLAAQYDTNARFKITASTAGVLTIAGIPQGATAQLFTLSNQPLAMSVVGETARYSMAEGEGVYLVVENATGTSTPSTLSVSINPKESYQAYYNGAHTNAFLAPDVNGDGWVTPIDALLIINRLNSRGSGLLDSFATNFVDVNRDGRLSPIDALLVINHLNSRSQMQGEGEEGARSSANQSLLALDYYFSDLANANDDVVNKRKLEFPRKS